MWKNKVDDGCQKPKRLISSVSRRSRRFRGEKVAMTKYL